MSRRAGAGAAVLLFLLAWLAGLDALQYERPPSKDAEQYVTFAYNLAHRGVFSLEGDPEREAAPSAYREPGYPALLAIGIRLIPGIRAMSLEAILSEEEQPRLAPLKHIQLALILLTVLMAGALISELTGNGPLTVTGTALIGLDASILSLADPFLSEVLIAPLFAGLSWRLAVLARRPTSAGFAVAGALTGSLALTRAAFYYFWMPAAAIMILIAWRRPDRRSLMLKGLAAFLAAFFVLVAPWMARNKVRFDRFFLAERGGMILAIRAEMDMMTRPEYLAAFLHFTNSRFLRDRLLPAWLGEEAAVRFGPEAGGFVQTARDRRAALLDQMKDRALADRALFNEALGRIASHPFRHLAVTLPLAHRGIYVERSSAMSLLLFLLAGAAMARAFVRRDAAALAAFAPALLSFGFHAFLTHNIPRYNVFLVPILWAAGATLAARWLRIEAA